MAELEYRKLSESEIAAELPQLSGWAVQNDQLAKEFAFKGYKDGLVFAVAVGYLADQMDHHPDLYIGYAKVRVAMNTHAVEGLSPYDLELARRIDRL